MYTLGPLLSVADQRRIFCLKIMCSNNPVLMTVGRCIYDVRAQTSHYHRNSLRSNVHCCICY